MLEYLNPAHAYKNPIFSLCGCEKPLLCFCLFKEKKHGKVKVFASLLALLLGRTQTIVMILLKPLIVNQPVGGKKKKLKREETLNFRRK